MWIEPYHFITGMKHRWNDYFITIIRLNLKYVSVYPIIDIIYYLAELQLMFRLRLAFRLDH